MKVRASISFVIVAWMVVIAGLTAPPAQAVEGEADLSIQVREMRLSDDNDPREGPLDHVVGGSAVEFAIAVTNNDPSVTATGVTVTIDEADYLTPYVDAGYFPCSMVGTKLQCTFGNLAPGKQVTRWIPALVKQGIYGDKTYGASVSSTTTDPVSSNNHSQAVQPFTDQADLSVALSVNGATPGKIGNDGVAYVGFSMTNKSSVRAPLDTIKVTWSEGLTLVNFEERCGRSAVHIACTTSLDPGQTLGGSIQLQADPAATGPFTITVEAVAGPYDPYPDNNTIEYVVQREIPSADVSMTSAANVTSAKRNQLITWTTTVTNAGPATAQGLELTDTYPVGTTLVSAPEGCVEHEGQQLVCERESLAVGESWTTQIVVRVQAHTRATYFINYAGLVVATADPDGQTSVAISEVALAKGRPASRPTHSVR